MTVLAALWSLDDRPAHDRGTAMIDAQDGKARATLWQEKWMALGSGDRPGDARTLAATPVTSASGSLVLVADVRLDNRAVLLRQLDISPGDAFELPDAGIMMMAFERWGIEATRRFVGDFAFILWDKAAGQLHLARDFAGQRPLFFHRSERTLAAASMASGIHVLDSAPRKPDRQRMLEMLAGLPHQGSRTFFEGVERVEPGAIVTLTPHTHLATAYWSPPSDPIRFRTDADYCDALIEKLAAAVDARVRNAGGRLGTHLSSGLDSSAVTALAADRFGGRVVAFTSVPSGTIPPLPHGRFGDEGALAASTASLYPNIEHRLVETGERIALEDLAWQLECFERPDLNLPNLAWSNRINDAAAEDSIKVMLTGTAGNATISYGDIGLLGEFLRKGLVGKFVGECMAAGRADMLVSVPAALVARIVLPARLMHRLREARRRHPPRPPILNSFAQGASEVIEQLSAMERPDYANSTETRLRMLRRVDPGSYNKGVSLRWDIDLRDPTADRDLVEFCLRIPIEQWFRGGISRALGRSALKGRIPDEVRLEQNRGLQSANWFAMLSNAREEAGHMLADLSHRYEVRELVDVDELHRLFLAWPNPSGTFGPLEYRTSFLRGLSAAAFVQMCAVGR